MKQNQRRVSIGTAKLSSTFELEKKIAGEIRKKNDKNMQEEKRALKDSPYCGFVRWA
jgi:hypothetical protein